MSQSLLLTLVIVIFVVAVTAILASVYGGSYLQTRVFVSQESVFTEESAGRQNLLDDYTRLEAHCFSLREECVQANGSSDCAQGHRTCLANKVDDPANCEFVYGVYASCLSDCALTDDEERDACEEACFDKAQPPYRLTACFDGCGHNPRECLFESYIL